MMHSCSLPCYLLCLMFATTVVIDNYLVNGELQDSDSEGTCMEQQTACHNALANVACRALNKTHSSGSLPLTCHNLLNSNQNVPRNRSSCQEILNYFPSAPSGYYQIHAPNGSQVQVYCDMEGTNCGGEGGWMRVAYVNMSQSGTTCPQGLTQKVLSGLTLCGRSDTSVGSCQSTFFPSFGLNYSQVCGQLRGYQWNTPDAFPPSTYNSHYVDGATITYGSSPRKHIWTYANGHSLTWAVCPCNTGVANVVPSFVGNDYYCETGNNGEGSFNFFPNDPLWDGQQCVGAEAPCCTHPNTPWFNKTLSETTTEDIEVRVCQDQATSDEDTLLQVIELFIY